MNFYQVVFSPCGGTKKAADYLTAPFTSSPVIIDLCDKDAEFDNIPFSSSDLVLIAVPVYGGRIPAPAMIRLQKMNGGGALAIAVTVYGNRSFGDALIELGELIGSLDFRCIAGIAAIAEHSVIKHYAARRPDYRDQKQLNDFSKMIIEKLGRRDISIPDLPGNSPVCRPYSLIPAIPNTKFRCDKCGLCAQKCPVGAIDKNFQTDDDICICCMRCIKICPKCARAINPFIKAIISYKLHKKCRIRRENSIFL